MGSHLYVTLVDPGTHYQQPSNQMAEDQQYYQDSYGPGYGNASIEYTGGDRGWAGDIPRAMLSIEKMLSTGYDVNYNSETAVRHTVRCLIEEIGM